MTITDENLRLSTLSSIISKLTLRDFSYDDEDEDDPFGDLFEDDGI